MDVPETNHTCNLKSEWKHVEYIYRRTKKPPNKQNQHWPHSSLQYLITIFKYVYSTCLDEFVAI